MSREIAILCGGAVHVRQDGEVEPEPGRGLGVALRRTDADGRDPRAERPEALHAKLQPVQIGHAEGSPVAAIEDQHGGVAGQLGQ